MTLIVYSDGEEVIFCTEEQEARMLVEYFDNGGRLEEDYDRDVSTEPVCFKTEIRRNY